MYFMGSFDYLVAYLPKHPLSCYQILETKLMLYVHPFSLQSKNMILFERKSKKREVGLLSKCNGLGLSLFFFVNLHKNCMLMLLKLTGSPVLKSINCCIGNWIFELKEKPFFASLEFYTAQSLWG